VVFPFGKPALDQIRDNSCLRHEPSLSTVSPVGLFLYQKAPITKMIGKEPFEVSANKEEIDCWQESLVVGCIQLGIRRPIMQITRLWIWAALPSSPGTGIGARPHRQHPTKYR
jgi:hypothetical protein